MHALFASSPSLPHSQREPSLRLGADRRRPVRSNTTRPGWQNDRCRVLLRERLVRLNEVWKRVSGHSSVLASK